MKTFFLATNNPYKLEEVQALAVSFGFAIKPFKYDIRELQTSDRKQLIRHKTVEAFTHLRSPVLVDHASLEIDCLNGMPGTLTQLFWDKLEGRICDIVTALGDSKARAVCTVAYCDGKEIYDDEGIVEGTISPIPTGARLFQWDTIFIPNGETRTYAEMEIHEKNSMSQRKVAFESLFHRIAKL